MACQGDKALIEPRTARAPIARSGLFHKLTPTKSTRGREEPPINPQLMKHKCSGNNCLCLPFFQEMVGRPLRDFAALVSIAPGNTLAGRCVPGREDNEKKTVCWGLGSCSGHGLVRGRKSRRRLWRQPVDGEFRMVLRDILAAEISGSRHGRGKSGRAHRNSIQRTSQD